MLIPFLLIALMCILLYTVRVIDKKDSTFKHELFNKIQGMFIENSDDGLWSSSRVVFVFTATLSNIILWVGILYLLIKNSNFPIVPESIIVVYGVANGITSISKILQKKQERLESENDNETEISRLTQERLLEESKNGNSGQK